jgi:lysophospholipase L1-like esterase
MTKTIFTVLSLCFVLGGQLAFTQQWVGTWVSAQQLTESSNMPPSPGLSNNTLRQVVHVTIGGSQLRVLFSNEYGNSALIIHSAHIAVSNGSGNINTGTDKALSFGGSASVTISAGQTVWSDTVSFNLAALSNLAVSLYFGSVPSNVTGHPGSRTTSYIQSGNAVTNTSLSGSSTDHWYILAGIDVATDGTYAAVVTLGDSITDGRGSTTNGNDRWPDALARRLQANAETNKVAVLNQGIGGNAVVSGGLGPTAVSRFTRDVVNQSGVKWCIVLEGVNDIGGSQSATNLINAYNEFIDKAHANNILIYGVPILPFGGSQYDSSSHESTRQTVNDWIRTSGRFDAVIDMDAAVRDSSNPNRLASAYDSGDHLHLNPAGYQKMADSIPLSLLTAGEGTPVPTSTPEPDQTPVPTGTPNQNPIWSGGPYSLNGSSSNYVDLPDGLTNDLSDFSIACWVKLNSLDTWSRIFDFGGDTNVFMMLTPASGNTGYPYFCITTSGNDGEQGINGTGTLPTGSWQHLAVSRSGNTGILYVNTQEAGRNAGITLHPSDLGNTTNNYIGRSQWSADPYLNADIDGFVVYNRALSAQEVSALGSTPPGGTGTLGDANGSGAIDIVDALIIAQYYVGLDPSGFIASNADTNCDGSINIVDALLVAQYYVGLINRFC